MSIKDSQETDQGDYECVAENSKGTEYSYEAKLYVRGMSRFVERYNSWLYILRNTHSL